MCNSETSDRLQWAYSWIVSCVATNELYDVFVFMHVAVAGSVNFFLQTEQLYGFSPVCIRRCFSMSPFFLFFANGNTMWLFSPERILNELSSCSDNQILFRKQNIHMVSPWMNYTMFFQVPCARNFFLQNKHSFGFSHEWTQRCMAFQALLIAKFSSANRTFTRFLSWMNSEMALLRLN